MTTPVVGMVGVRSGSFCSVRVDRESSSLNPPCGGSVGQILYQANMYRVGGDHSIAIGPDARTEEDYSISIGGKNHVHIQIGALDLMEEFRSLRAQIQALQAEVTSLKEQLE